MELFVWGPIFLRSEAWVHVRSVWRNAEFRLAEVMGYLPICESLFPLSDDLSNVEVVECGGHNHEVLVEVPHRYLGIDFGRAEKARELEDVTH